MRIIIIIPHTHTLENPQVRLCGGNKLQLFRSSALVPVSFAPLALFIRYSHDDNKFHMIYGLSKLNQNFNLIRGTNPHPPPGWVEEEFSLNSPPQFHVFQIKVKQLTNRFASWFIVINGVFLRGARFWKKGCASLIKCESERVQPLKMTDYTFNYWHRFAEAADSPLNY